jgi:hypothetical protein
MPHIANPDASVTRRIGLLESKCNRTGVLVNASFSTRNTFFAGSVSRKGPDFLLSLLPLSKLFNGLAIRENFTMNLL